MPDAEPGGALNFTSASQPACRDAAAATAVVEAA